MKLKIDIGQKYLYVRDNEDKMLAYFEHFQEKTEKKSVISLSVEDRKGGKFIKENHCVIQNADVYWFSNKKLVYRAIFIKEKFGAFQYLILTTPKLLTIK